MDAVMCDCGCKETAPAEGLMGWYKLEFHGIDVGPLGRSLGPWHFVDERHLEVWLAQR